MRIRTGTTGARRKLAGAGCVVAVAALGGIAALAGGAAASGAAPAASGAVPGAGHVTADGVTVPAPAWNDRASAPPTTADCQQSVKLNCYSPAQIQQAYSLNGIYGQGISGKGVTIAIIDPEGSPTIGSDLATFDSAFSLPNPSLTILRPDGGVQSFNAKNSAMENWATETTMDVEWAHAIAPGAKILLVETPLTGGFPDGYYAEAEKYVIEHHLANVISQSWGVPEPQDSFDFYGIQNLAGDYAQAEREHITVLASAGDNGPTNPTSESKTSWLTEANVQFPASDPLVTAVGGTRLSLDANGNRVSPDVVWNDTWNTVVDKEFGLGSGPNGMAGGGGDSIWFDRPSFQSSVWKTVGAMRGLPDISMSAACSADPLTYASFPGQTPGWTLSCGTSIATPMFAGIVALADQLAGHALGFINPAIYKLAAERAPGIVLVTSGNTTVSFRQDGSTYTVHGFKARAGYSRATGVGTIDGQYFIPELARLG
jgi:subtilase family serine protease